ncbi:MAG: glycosyltransferase [Bacteroidota bacterium]|nr:glycosyltransferase [Bacteroidota bacterium]
MQPLVSIALCTYNTGPFLVPLLNSLLQQSWENTEIVCCDDKSSDDTVKTLEKFQLQYPGRIWLYQNETNLGYIKNFEQCLSLCSGEWIALADHDDSWMPKKLETLVKAIGDAMLVYSDSVLINEAGNETGKKISDRFRLHDRPHPNAFAFYDFTWGHTMLLRKELLEYALPIPANMPYDTWLAYTAASISTIRYVNETLTGWRQHDYSFTAVMYQKNKQRGETKNRKYEEYAEKLERIQLLKNNNYCANKAFMEDLYSYYESVQRGFSWKLFFFLTRYQKTLFPIWRRSYISKLNEFRKMARRVKKFS